MARASAQIFENVLISRSQDPGCAGSLEVVALQHRLGGEFGRCSVLPLGRGTCDGGQQNGQTDGPASSICNHRHCSRMSSTRRAKLDEAERPPCSRAMIIGSRRRKVESERRRSRGPGRGGAGLCHRGQINGGGLFLPCPAWHWERLILKPGSARLTCPEPDLLLRRRFWSPRRSHSWGSARCPRVPGCRRPP